VSAILYDAQQRILLVRQRESMVWSTPGGGIEPDETPTDALVREVWEEIGLHVRPVRILGVFGGPAFVIRYPNGDVSQYVMSVFECSVLDGALRRRTDETVDARYVDEAEFGRLPASAWTHEVLPLMFRSPTVALFPPVGWLPPG
jgi:ADP-ribose pyrophosphatase YjhB (NUDIX family)